jgi:hypothetical protein
MSNFVTVSLKSGKESRHWHSGQGIGQFADVEEMSRVADAAGVMPLQSFYFEYESFYVEVFDGCPEEIKRSVGRKLQQVQQVQWHDPSEGLKTVSALLKHYRKHQNFHGADVVLEDLEAYRRVLAEAEREGDKFRLEISD